MMIGEIKLGRFYIAPFDWRWTVFNSNVAVHLRKRVMRHMLDGENIGLICTRQTKDEWGAMVTRDVCAHKTCGAYDGNFLFPLELRAEAEAEAEQLQLEQQGSRPNLSEATLRKFSNCLATGSDKEMTAEDIFNYTYGVFYSPEYRARYVTFLKIGFPRVPIPGKMELFYDLAHLGRQLVQLHLMESRNLEQKITEFIGSNYQVSNVIYTADNGGTVWIDGKGNAKNPQPGTSGFSPVPEEGLEIPYRRLSGLRQMAQGP